MYGFLDIQKWKQVHINSSIWFKVIGVKMPPMLFEEYTATYTMLQGVSGISTTEQLT